MLYGKLSNESERYRKARAELLEAEMGLRDQRERVAELRRALPLDTRVDDYLFHDGRKPVSRTGSAHTGLEFPGSDTGRPRRLAARCALRVDL